MEAATSAGHFDDSLGDPIDGDDEEDAEEEDLIEPRFRYKRILGDLMRLMENDAASSFCMHDKLLVVGFQSGRVCIFDHMGNVNIDSCSRHHKCAVSCVSIDDSANYILSCANDFTIVVFGIGCVEYNQRLTLKTSARVVAISPDFSRPGSGQRFLAAAQDLTLYERGVRAELFAGRRRETGLYRGQEKDGWISCLSWKHSLIAFTNETGTRIYDLKLSRCITLVQPIHKNERFPTAKFPPKHAWLNSTTLAIGWANTLCICGIFQNTRRMSTTSELFEGPIKKYGQILHKFVLHDFTIAGVSFTTKSSYGADPRQQLLMENPPIPLSSPPSTANLPSALTVVSPNASTKNLQALAAPATSPPPPNDGAWRELIIFGIKKCGSTRESSILNFTNASISQNNSTDQASIIASDPDDPGGYMVQLLLLRPISLQEYFLEAEDTIEMRNVGLKQLHRFTLCSLPLDDIYLILGPREAIEALPCSIDNRINWLMENGLYEDALESAIRNVQFLRENSVLDVGKRLINHLIEQRDFATAAGYLPEVCGKRKEEWAFYVNEFERHHQVLKLVPVIPTKEPRLEPENYQPILIAALYSRPKLFHAIVSHWDAELYRAGHIVSEIYNRITVDNENRRRLRTTQRTKPDGDSVQDQVLSDQDRGYMLRALASLLLQSRKYNDAIKTYLVLRDPAIFGAIERHKLFPYVQDRIMELMEINQDLAIRLLLDNEDSHEKVVQLLGNHPKIQLAYLHRLQARGEGAAYSDRLVKLYAEHDRPALLPFLRKNENYRLDLALDICRRADYIEEVVYLLGRSGNRLGALDLMVNKLLRIDLAIDFCAENDDPELWERLIESAIKRPEQITVLLKRMGSIKVNSLDIIRKIPLQMDIADLRQCLLQVLRDHEQQRDLLAHSKNVANSDVLELLETRLKPMAIITAEWDQQELRCAICHTPLMGPSKHDFLLLAGGKMVHERCGGGGPRE